MWRAGGVAVPAVLPAAGPAVVAAQKGPPKRRNTRRGIGNTGTELRTWWTLAAAGLPDLAPG
jgi:hypothetical protein